MKKYKMLLGICIMIAGLFILFGCPAPQEEPQEEEQAEPQFYALGGGPSGGSFAAFAAALSEVINDDLAELVNVTPSGTAGSGENIVFVNNNEVELGISDGLSMYRAYKGIAPFELSENVRAIGLITFGSLHFVTLADSGIETIEDLAGRKVATGTVGSATEATIQIVTELLGFWEQMEKENLLGGDAITALQDGHVDAFGWTAPHPNGAIEDLSTLHEVVVLDSLTSAKAAGLLDQHPFFWEGVIPAGTYGIPADVPVVLSGLYLIANKDLDEELVYQMTKLIYESTERLKGINVNLRHATLDNALIGLTMPLHPGAQRFFEEAGLEIPEAIQAR